MIEEIIKRLIRNYETLISELELIDVENKAFISTANEMSEDPLIIEWSRFARENQRRLIMARAEKEFLEEKLSNN